MFTLRNIMKVSVTAWWMNIVILGIFAGKWLSQTVYYWHLLTVSLAVNFISRSLGKIAAPKRNLSSLKSMKRLELDYVSSGACWIVVSHISNLFGIFTGCKFGRVQVPLIENNRISNFMLGVKMLWDYLQVTTHFWLSINYRTKNDFRTTKSFSTYKCL